MFLYSSVLVSLGAGGNARVAFRKALSVQGPLPLRFPVRLQTGKPASRNSSAVSNNGRPMMPE
jgi:hypothetical protein